MMIMKRIRAKRADIKTARVGANLQKRLDEKRAQRPRAIAGAVRRVSKIAAIIMLAAAVGYAVFAYGPTVSANISDAAKSNKRLPATFKVTGCDKATSERLKNSLDALLFADPLGFDRAQVQNQALLIPEIEKISIRKIKDRKSRDVSTLIKVTERKPVALIHCGRISLVDGKGVRFSPRQGRFYELPLLVIGEDAAPDTVGMDIFNQIRKTSKNLGGAFFQQISQIDVSEDSSVSLRFKSGEAEYVIGVGDIEERLIHVMRLRERLLEDIGEPARIDLRYRSLAFASSL